MAADRAEFISALREELRERLAVDESSTVGTREEMPNGYQLRFRAGLQVDQMSEVARVYAAIANAKERDEKQNFAWLAIAVALVTCLMIAIRGAALAWVKAGFAGAR